MRFKLFDFITSIFLLILTCFLMLKLLPGSPFDEEQALQPAMKEYLEQKYHVHDNFITQTVTFIYTIVRGDFGESISHPGVRISKILEQVIKNTILLNLFSVLFIYICGLSLGVLPFLLRGKTKRFFQVINVFLLSLPTQLVTPILLFLFSFYWKVFPFSFLESPMHYVLPIISISFRPIGLIASSLQVSIAEQIKKDYVRTATAKGISQLQILFKHILKNSMVSLLAMTPQTIISVLSGSYIVEILFLIPGTGLTLYNAISDRDFPLIIAIVFCVGSFFIALNFITDLLLKIIDPRVDNHELNKISQGAAL